MIALVLAAALLADPLPPIVVWPTPPAPETPTAVFVNNPVENNPFITVDTVCDHGNRLYRSRETHVLTVIPRDPSCPGGRP